MRIFENQNPIYRGDRRDRGEVLCATNPLLIVFLVGFSSVFASRSSRLRGKISLESFQLNNLSNFGASQLLRVSAVQSLLPELR
jgi:hypothetical protein